MKSDLEQAGEVQNSSRMGDFEIPAWSGPLAGLIVGALVGLSAIPAPWPIVTLFVATGAAIGCLAGSLLLLWQRPKQGTLVLSGWLGKSMAVAALVVSLIPVLGVFVSVDAIWINWRAADWPRSASVIAFGVALIMLVPFIIMLAASFQTST